MNLPFAFISISFKNRKKNNLSQILSLETDDGFDVDIATKQVKNLVKDIRPAVNTLSKMPNKVDLSKIFSSGITTGEIEDIYEELREQEAVARQRLKDDMPDKIGTEVKFVVKISEDIDP